LDYLPEPDIITKLLRNMIHKRNKRGPDRKMYMDSFW